MLDPPRRYGDYRLRAGPLTRFDDGSAAPREITKPVGTSRFRRERLSPVLWNARLTLRQLAFIAKLNVRGDFDRRWWNIDSSRPISSSISGHDTTVIFLGLPCLSSTSFPPDVPQAIFTVQARAGDPNDRICCGLRAPKLPTWFSDMTRRGASPTVPWTHLRGPAKAASTAECIIRKLRKVSIKLPPDTLPLVLFGTFVKLSAAQPWTFRSACGAPPIRRSAELGRIAVEGASTRSPTYCTVDADPTLSTALRSPPRPLLNLGSGRDQQLARMKLTTTRHRAQHRGTVATTGTSWADAWHFADGTAVRSRPPHWDEKTLTATFTQGKLLRSCRTVGRYGFPRPYDWGATFAAPPRTTLVRAHRPSRRIVARRRFSTGACLHLVEEQRGDLRSKLRADQIHSLPIICAHALFNGFAVPTSVHSCDEDSPGGHHTVATSSVNLTCSDGHCFCLFYQLHVDKASTLLLTFGPSPDSPQGAVQGWNGASALGLR